MKRYEVTCLKCKQSDILLIDDNSHAIINYGKGASTNLLAGRWRKDERWGWECSCSNDSRIGKQEEAYIKELVTSGNKQAINDIIKGLNIKDEKKFSMKPV